MMRRRILLALLATASPLGAQLPAGSQLELGPQVVQYRIKAPFNETITEFALPIFAVVPISRAFALDIGTAYAQSRVEYAQGTSTVAGLTDTQVRASYTVGTDLVILTAGVNVPTGRSTVSAEELAAASRIGNDFLSFPISNLGTGAAFTGGLAVARPLGIWNVGAGGSVRMATAFEPFEPETGTPPRYQPGNEYKLRVGADRTIGDGQLALGFTFSTFGQDDFGGSVYNTGDRYIGQVAWSRVLPGGTLNVSAWNLYRGAGQLVDGFTVPWDNITSGSVAFGFRTPDDVTIEPSLQVRSWLQAVAATETEPARTDRSMLGEVGVRARIAVGRLAVYPGAGFTVGRLAAGASQSAPLTGFRASLGVQAR